MPSRRSDAEIRTLVTKMLVKEGFLKSEDDTDFGICNARIRQRHFTSNNLNGLLCGRFKGSPIAALEFCFPEYPWDRNIMSKKPQKHWLNIDNAKIEVEKIRTQRGWSIEDCHKLAKNDYPSGLQDVYPSPIALLRAVYPETQWEPYLMTVVPKNTWDDFENHRKVIQHLEKKLEIRTPEEWWDKLDGDTFQDFQGLLQLRYDSSPTRLLSAVYPQLGEKLWRFKKVPQRYWTDITTVKFMSDFAEARGIKTPDEWYSVTCDDIDAHGGAGLVGKHKSHIDLITKFVTTPTDFKWNRAKFNSTWTTERMIGDFLAESHTVLRGCEFRPKWLKSKTSPLEMDITLRDRPICVEVDGPGHFKTMWYGSHEGTFTRDIRKMKAATENGYFGIRIYQPTVLSDKTMHWKEWLKMALSFISEHDEPAWVFPLKDAAHYASHIDACTKSGIKTHCI